MPSKEEAMTEPLSFNLWMTCEGCNQVVNCRYDQLGRFYCVKCWGSCAEEEPKGEGVAENGTSPPPPDFQILAYCDRCRKELNCAKAPRGRKLCKTCWDLNEPEDPLDRPPPRGTQTPEEAVGDTSETESKLDAAFDRAAAIAEAFPHIEAMEKTVSPEIAEAFRHVDEVKTKIANVVARAAFEKEDAEIMKIIKEPLPGPISIVSGVMTEEEIEALRQEQVVLPHKPPDNDPIHHPAHYTKGDLECWDAIDGLWDPINPPYYESTILKYLLRWDQKGKPLHDLRKAREFLNKLIKNVEKREANRAAQSGPMVDKLPPGVDGDGKVYWVGFQDARVGNNPDRLQAEVGEWADKNFPHNRNHSTLLGLVEEVGELSRAHLKFEQGVRYTKDEACDLMFDAIGDTLIYLAAYCHDNGFSLQECVTEVWAEVKKRDWVKYPKNGVSE